MGFASKKLLPAVPCPLRHSRRLTCAGLSTEATVSESGCKPLAGVGQAADLKPPCPAMCVRRREALLAGAGVAIGLSLAPRLSLARTKDPQNASPTSKVLRVAMSSRPVHLNPALVSGSHTGVPAAQLFASLLRIDRQWKLHPNLAQAWSKSADGRTLQFELRRRAKFHDGAPITSADVAFSIETVKKHHPFINMLAAVDAIETPTPHVVVLQLSRPTAYIELVAASPMLPILPKHIYGDGQPIKTHPANRNVVGSGPFRLVRWTDEGLELEKFDDYFIPGRPLLDKLFFNIVEERTIQIAVETGRVQLHGFSSDARVIAELEKRPDIVVDTGGYAGIGATRVLMFNLRRAPFNHPLVRRAIALTVDKQSVARVIYLGKVKPISSPIAPDSPYYFSVPDVDRYDPALANRLLDQAGYARNNQGIRFSIVLEVGTDPAGPYYMEQALHLKHELLDKLGVNVHINYTTKFSEYAERVANWEYDAAYMNYFNWGDPAIGVHRMYDSKNIRKGVVFSNMTSYADKTVDALIEAAESTADLEERRQIYKKLQIKLASDLPILPLTGLPFATIYSKGLAGIGDGIWGSMIPLDEAHWISVRQ